MSPVDPLLKIHEAAKECATCHENKRPAPPHIAKGDCVQCHKYPEFKGAVFLHTPKPTQCETCHTRPMDGERSYPHQGPPKNLLANGPGTGHYLGKDCVSCHQTPEEGQKTFVFTHSKPNPGVCLPCHYNNGSREHGNSSKVQLSDFGNCNSCHSRFDKASGRDF